MYKAHILSAFFSIYICVPAFAASSPHCRDIDKAISANEDFVEVALGIDKLPLPPALAEIRAGVISVRGGMSVAEQAQSAQIVGVIEDQIAKPDLPMAAVAAIENYKVLVVAYQSRLTTSLDTAMLDYVGFKLLGLTAAKPLNWAAMAETVDVSRASWDKTRAALKDQGVIDLVDSAQGSMANALSAKDPAWLASTAQTLLDAVDLIERESRNPSKTACK